MDPIEAFNRMMDATEYGRIEEAQEAAEALLGWLDNGGFVPMFRISADDRTQYLVSDRPAAETYRLLCQSVLAMDAASPTVDRQP